MSHYKHAGLRRRAAALLSAALLLASGCGDGHQNLLPSERVDGRVVNLFSPMEKTDPDAENLARTAADLTIAMAEDTLGVTVAYRTYTAEDYQDKTYDDVALDRARNDMDDLYLLNPDTVLALGSEGKLADLSGLDSVKNLRDIILTANTVDGRLVAIPQEVVAYGLFLNMDLFRQYNLEAPNTPEELLECCRVFQENGIDTPIGANRWWLECFVFAQAYADLYNGGTTEAEIAALNSGEAKYSDYMRPGFQFLQTLIDEGTRRRPWSARPSRARGRTSWREKPPLSWPTGGRPTRRPPTAKRTLSYRLSASPAAGGRCPSSPSPAGAWVPTRITWRTPWR